jgi:hypothetical protein
VKAPRALGHSTRCHSQTASPSRTYRGRADGALGTARRILSRMALRGGRIWRRTVARLQKSRAITRSPCTITAPIGTSSSPSACWAFSRASFMKCSCTGGCFPGIIPPRSARLTPLGAIAGPQRGPVDRGFAVVSPGRVATRLLPLPHGGSEWNSDSARRFCKPMPIAGHCRRNLRRRSGAEPPRPLPRHPEGTPPRCIARRSGLSCRCSPRRGAGRTTTEDFP